MIERYSRPQMRAIWTEENKFNAYLKVEILSCEAWSRLGVIPGEDVRKIAEKARFDVERIREIEEQTRHDVVDTANGWLIRQADEILLQDIYITNGVIFAQRVMNALIGKGLSREQAYDTVQPLAMKAWSEHVDYAGLLKDSEAVTALLSVQEIDDCFTLDYYFKNVDYIFRRVGILA